MNFLLTIYTRALATAGLVGNLIKTNASVAGAEVGCQGEVGSACSMAAGTAARLLGGSIRHVEYAATIGMEHFLGLTCDPMKGLVQIPCIDRNAQGASRATICLAFTRRLPREDWQLSNVKILKDRAISRTADRTILKLI